MEQTPPNSPDSQVEIKEPRVEKPLFKLMDEIKKGGKKTLYFQFDNGELHKIMDVEPNGCELIFKNAGDYLMFSEKKKIFKIFLKDNE